MRRLMNAFQQKIETLLKDDPLSRLDELNELTSCVGGPSDGGCNPIDPIDLVDGTDTADTTGAADTADFKGSSCKVLPPPESLTALIGSTDLTNEEKELQCQILSSLKQRGDQNYSDRSGLELEFQGGTSRSDSQIYSNKTISCSEITPIPHIRQSETWDCGLTCVQMILGWLRQKTTNTIDTVDDAGVGVRHSVGDLLDEKSWMVQFVGTESIWTIDLVMLLNHVLCTSGKNSAKYKHRPTKPVACVSELQLMDMLCSASYLFCSTQLGVDESYNKLGYYKDAFSTDEMRVKKLFDCAKEQSMPLMQVQCISLHLLVEIVSQKDLVAIVLLDNRILLHQCAKGEKDTTTNERLCSGTGTSSISRSNEQTVIDDGDTAVSSPSKSSVFSCFDAHSVNHTGSYDSTTSLSNESSYSGHYVILCGISHDRGDICSARSFSTCDKHDKSEFCMVIKNPGSWRETEFITPTRFERAWRAKGTDEDIIFIAKHNN